MLFKTVVFTDAPILKGFRYRNRFQLVPYFYAKSTPMSKYAKHFPAFLEYEVDVVEEELGIEQALIEKGFRENTIKEGRTLPSQERVKIEILHLLTCLTNYKFFSYNPSVAYWGIPIPSHGLDEPNEEEWGQLKEPTSQWTLGGYVFPGLKQELVIKEFTNVFEYYQLGIEDNTYFTNNPGVWLNSELSFPPRIEYCIDRYYSLKNDIYTKVKHCIGLLNDGIMLFDTKRSVSLLTIISSIEGMAALDLKLYGEHKDLGALNRFLRYLRIHVAGRSEDKFRTYYKKRCSITHEGELFIGDLDVYSDIKEQHKDWLLRLEIQQVARLAFYNWLRMKHESLTNLSRQAR